MGTRSRIGLQLADESILSVYCHYDGYPEYNGKVLREFYTTKEQVAELIDGGNISCLRTNAGWNNETLPQTGPLYYTARNETIEENAPEMTKDAGQYLKTADDCGEEYAYIFADGEWSCYNVRYYDDAYLERVAIPEGSIND
jgi:hypothetical protein